MMLRCRDGTFAREKLYAMIRILICLSPTSDNYVDALISSSSCSCTRRSWGYPRCTTRRLLKCLGRAVLGHTIKHKVEHMSAVYSTLGHYMRAVHNFDQSS